MEQSKYDADFKAMAKRSELEEKLRNSDTLFRKQKTKTLITLFILILMAALKVFQFVFQQKYLKTGLESAENFKDYAVYQSAFTIVILVLGIICTVLLVKLKNSVCRKRSCNQWGAAPWGVLLLLVPPIGAAIAIASLVPMVTMKLSDYEEALEFELEKVTP